ncbi:ectoine/hydroxyectoine ABC transporter substrate-binding protein EhuB [Achromobacter aloeverae]|uniref:ectoine/hydroxyectoine ABC transporter substrate-binding protein EhuB n=1 Tax=Achromobacter aloeverae TaxID=1750518 RepID=UPI001F00F54D|nr:ectoine/hydroxyectoine ABC transporter substrate-binding protein EhuB [Achromobacter aloeverae]
MPKSLRLAIVAAIGAGLLGYAAVRAGGDGGGRPQAQARAPDTLAQARAKGEIRVGYANEAPFAYMDSRGNQVTGESVEIARVVLRRLGIRHVQAVLTEFGSLIPGLNAGRFDIIAAGMYVTPDRCRQVAFSDPTYGVGAAFLVPAHNPRNLHGYEDLARQADARLGIVVGAIEGDYAAAVGIPADRMVIFPDAVSALAGVQVGRADAYAATALTINHLLGKLPPDGGLETAQPFSDPVIDGKPVRGYGAYAFRKDDQALVDAFNAELKRFIGTPEHRRLVAPFGFTEKELPRGMTAARLCAGQ